MRHDAFSAYHPAVNLLFFVLLIGFSMLLMHPLCLAVSMLCALSYALWLGGGRTRRFCLRFLLPMALLAALLNPLFNHEGATILCYLWDGNPLTLESILYGLAAGAMLACVILWFSCFHAVMTTDKFVYLFGRLTPALSLLLSMTLRFVPRFRAELSTVVRAQSCLGHHPREGSPLRRARHGLRILSILITWSLEQAIDTADSMAARGYGLPGRTAFSLYRFTRRDILALCFLLLCGTVIALGTASGLLSFHYFPTAQSAWHGPTAIPLLSYFALGMTPLILQAKEALRWRATAPET